jgi:hypothetical protein
MGADFAFIKFDQHLGDNENDLNTPAGFTWAGGQATKEFTINGSARPVGQGYLLIQTYDVDFRNHEILINGKKLPGWDIPTHPADQVWQTWMERIPSGFLKAGTNTIQIVKSATTKEKVDNFLVRSVTVHWREES